MPLIHEFEYIKIKTLKEALELKKEYGERAKILAGGTDIIPLLKDNIISPELLIDLKSLKELSDIEFKNGVIKIGAGITFADLIKSKIIKKYLPILWEASMTVASVGVRNRATVAGNICSAVPCADSAGPLLVYQASLNLSSLSGDRVVGINEWFTGPKKTSIRNDEILKNITLKIPQIKNAGCYLKLSRYEGEDLAQGSFTVIKEGEEYRIAFGSLAPTPRRAYKTEEYLKGKKITEKVIADVQEIITQEISPITDIRATKEYRTYMSKVMIKRAIEKTISRYYNGKPKYGEGMIE